MAAPARLPSHEAVARAEDKLLVGIPSCRAFDVALESKAESMHTIELKLSAAPDGGSGTALVMLPGYGLGAAAFFMCFEAFVERHSQRAIDASTISSVYALDWPGSGLCSQFEPEGLALSSESREAAVDKLVGYCADRIEQWRLAMGLDRIVLLGHSLGGYLAFCYCERYSRWGAQDCAHASVTHLLLCSPCGLPMRPDERAPPGNFSEDDWLARRAEELEAGRRPITEFDPGSRNRHRFAQLRCRLCPLLCPLLCCCAPCFCAMRCCRRRAPKQGPSGKPLGEAPPGQLDAPVSNGLRRVRSFRLRSLLARLGMRFRMENNGQWDRAVPKKNRRALLADYLHRYAVWNAAGNGRAPSFGEHFFDRVMFPGSYGSFGWTRVPLGGNCNEVLPDGSDRGNCNEVVPLGFSDGRIQRFLRQASTSPGNFHLSFFYGDQDWMDSRYAEDVSREFSGAVAPCNGGKPMKVMGSGHQIPIDSPNGFVERVLAILEHEV